MTCPHFPHTSYYDIRVVDGSAGGATAVVVAVGKWETRSVFQGGAAPVFSTAFCAALARANSAACGTQTAVRPLLVISPPRRDLRRASTIRNQLTASIRPQFAVKTLHASVLHRPPRLDVHQLDLPFDTPRQKITAGQFWPVVATNPRGRRARRGCFQHRVTRRLAKLVSTPEPNTLACTRPPR